MLQLLLLRLQGYLDLEWCERAGIKGSYVATNDPCPATMTAADKQTLPGYLWVVDWKVGLVVNGQVR